MPGSRSQQRRASGDSAQPSVEMRLSVLLLSARRSSEALGRARDLVEQNAIDWETLIRLTEKEQISSLLYQITRDTDVVPEMVLHRWRAAHLSNGARNALVFSGLESILERLTTNGVPVALLKGAALAATIYESPALRPMGDVDLLIRRADLDQARSTLVPLGYAHLDDPELVALAPLIENEIALARKEGQPALVELHWSLFDSPYYQRKLTPDWLWGSATPVRIGREATQVLGPEAQLIHLCGHLLYHHRGHGLLWHHDIAEWMFHYRVCIDWDALLACAQQFDLVLPIQLILPRVAGAWQAPIPAEILSQLRSLRPTREELGIYHGQVAGETSVARHLWSDLTSMSSWQMRFAYALRSLFPPPAYMMARYDICARALVPFYYPYRWLAGVRRKHRK